MWTGRLIFTAAFHGLFAMTAAYFLSMLNSIDIFVKQFANESIIDHYDYVMNDEVMATAWSATASLFCFGVIGSTFFVQRLAEYIGRKLTVMVATNFVIILSCILLFAAVNLGTFELFLIGRVLTGTSRAFSWFTPIYLAESAPPEHRATVGLLSGIGMRLWFIFSVTLALPQVLGTENLWPYLFLAPIPASLIHLAGSIYFPESPKYLYISRNDVDGAKQALRFFHGSHADHSHTLKTFEAEKTVATCDKISIIQVLKTRHMRIPLCLCVCICLLASAGGANLSIHYSTSMMRSLGIANAELMTVAFVHTPSLFITVFSVLNMDRFGRRPFLIGGGIVGTIGIMLLFVGSLLKDTVQLEGNLGAILAVIGVSMSQAAVSLGPAFMHSFMPGELCPQASRSLTWLVCFSSGWIWAMIELFVYPPLYLKIGAYALLPYIFICLSLTTILIIYLPETKGTNVSEIVARWVRTVKSQSDLNKIKLEEKILKYSGA